MIDRFLNAKHWQVFILIFGIPFLLQMLYMMSMSFSIFMNEDPEVAIFYISFLPIIIIVSIVFFFAWFYSIGVGLQKSIPSEFRTNVKRFKLFLFIPAIYILSLMVFISYTMTNMAAVAMNSFIFVFIIPLHLFSMFCIFYCLYFVAKTYKTAELQREVSFGDFVGEFFLFWFYPIGVWFLQPKINEMHLDSD